VSTRVTFDCSGASSPLRRLELRINQGPIVLMIENYRSGMPWRLMRGCAPFVEARGGQDSRAAGWGESRAANMRACLARQGFVTSLDFPRVPGIRTQ
jgi:hypothetical protein